MPKYQVTDSRGKVHKRNTKASGRVYTHAVVAFFPEYIGKGEGGFEAGRVFPERGGASWSGSRALAERQAAKDRKSWRPVIIEIIEAQEV